MIDTVCITDGCDRIQEISSRGLCRGCYQRKFRRIKKIHEWVDQWRSHYEAGRVADTITGPGGEMVALADLIAEIREWETPRRMPIAGPQIKRRATNGVWISREITQLTPGQGVLARAPAVPISVPPVRTLQRKLWSSNSPVGLTKIQTIMGRGEATAIRWQRFLTGFRMLLFSGKHGRSYEDVSLLLDYLKNNPMRAKEMVNKDNEPGVTNTYHLMFLLTDCTARPWVARARPRRCSRRARSIFPIRPSQRDPDAQPHPQPVHPAD